MDKTLNEAINLREQGQKDASRTLLLQLVSENPTNAKVLYHCAWTHDGMGLEREAVTFYERAIENGLAGDELCGAFLGLGTTLRGLGEYKRALEILERGAKEFPTAKSIRVFLAMALYNNGRSKEAVSDLLVMLAKTSSEKEVTDFKRAILLYAVDLDRIWEA